jgi:hypothetical protein
MSKEKYEELRRKRFREREERFKKEGKRIREQNLAIWQRRWIEAAKRKMQIQAQPFLDKKSEQEKARKAIRNARMIVQKIEEQLKSSLYVPEITKKIDEMMIEADKSFDLKEYENVVKLSHEVKELAEKAKLEVSIKSAEKKRRRKEEGRYFYCIIPCNEEKTFGNLDMNNEKVYTIPYRNVAAVVSESPMKDYELTEDNMKRHEEVIRRVMEEHTVVPVEFGTVIQNERILKHLLKKAYDPVRECLRLVDNMVELGVKAVINGDIVFADSEKRNECATNILESLNNRAKQLVKSGLFSDRLILNASFLVNKEEINTFSNEVTDLQEKYPMIKLLYSGPWAPYNFVRIRIGAEGMQVSKNG